MERLLLVDGTETLERLRVTHTASPRLVVADVDPDSPLPPGVREVGDDADLDETERLFASAWARRTTESKDRPGEGSDWDAPGFEAP